MTKPVDRRAVLRLAGLGAASLAVAKAIGAPASGFDAAGYVAMWERAGKVALWGADGDGGEWFGFRHPRGSADPDLADLYRFGAAKKADPYWEGKVIDFLKGRQPAGLPSESFRS
jgi:hypothetical protein